MIARNIIIVRILETIVMYCYVSFSKSKDTKKIMTSSNKLFEVKA